MIRAIDIRPANGVLYGLATPDSITTQVRLYSINQITGVATAVGPAVNVAMASGFWGMSFNAVVDRVRVVNTANANARLHPDTGALAANDTPLALPGRTGFGGLRQSIRWCYPDHALRNRYGHFQAAPDRWIPRQPESEYGHHD